MVTAPDQTPPSGPPQGDAGGPIPKPEGGAIEAARAADSPAEKAPAKKAPAAPAKKAPAKKAPAKKAPAKKAPAKKAPARRPAAKKSAPDAPASPSATSRSADPVHDVVVVGAGPAGSSCGYWLADAGWDVVVVEKKVFPGRRPAATG